MGDLFIEEDSPLAVRSFVFFLNYKLLKAMVLLQCNMPLQACV